MDTVPSYHECLINLRQKLLSNEILVEGNGILIFVQDYVFNPPSTAGGLVLVPSTNGWKKCKDNRRN
ncbi:MAG TPA: DUF4357 domain-containing protein [Maribacter sp.]|nr:DUF4357 domain-containing protein [Maribacter sp.]HEA78930.1 DUF4357 domain-containing protein [Maribacter sp.]